MSTLHALRTLVLGETWLLPIGIAALVAVGLLLRPLAPDAWQHVGGFVLLAAVLALLLTSVARAARGGR